MTDYFNQSGLDAARLREFGREDVPTLLFKNRFLDTFSRPMRERAAFIDQTLSEQPWQDQTVSSYGPGGIAYHKFDLVLPKEATVSRVDSKSILINAPKFVMTLSVVFDGFASVLPRGFEELYLGEVEFPDVSVYQVGISVNVEFKPFALLTRTGWDYHAWIDSFLLKVDHRFSGDSFLKHIQWSGAVTLARVVERVIARQSAAVKPRTEA
ncbi:hypothetical protein [Acidovorax sp. 94]|uniref:hypothetical protein n=1 Tax=Acidovorax sp. 94 TaxID=2135633 RepID=UPI000EB1606D|nr:hypothetical protein [Acidovorax sp. 94]